MRGVIRPKDTEKMLIINLHTESTMIYFGVQKETKIEQDLSLRPLD